MSPDAVRAFLLHGRRTGKLAVQMKDGHPHVMPVWFVLDGEQIVHAYVHVRGRASVSEDPEELLHWATEIGARYMGRERAEEYGRRNAVPGELLVRLTPERVIAETGIAT